MTDTSSSLLAVTHLTPQPAPVTTTPSAVSPLPNGSLSDTNAPDEEPYTIKCTCHNAEDDGNTVYCPSCDTWQHIRCYYQSNKDVPEEHFCEDCRPNSDIQRLVERAKKLRDGQNGGDRKKQRPTSKVQKKRPKENSAIVNADQINGWHGHERSDSAVGNKDHPPPLKKPKTSHRNSGSVVSLTGTANLSDTHGRKRATSNVQSYPSPSKSPQDLYRFPGIPTYTPDFLNLYNRDDGREHVSVTAASQYTDSARAKIEAWHDDPSLLASEKGRPNPEPPFIETNSTLDSSYWPKVAVHVLRHDDLEYDGRYPVWHSLRIQSEVQKDDLVGEVRGHVGLLEEYCRQGLDNRWHELQHPDPFVFFHPHMNIFIDSRREGTQFRYVRRSCRPNVTLKTFVTEDGQYHHCFVANQHILPGNELTAAWYLPQDLWASEQVDTEDRKKRRIFWASLLLANFGDCACEPPQICLLAGHDHRYSPKALEIPQKQASVKKRKVKGKRTISPLSTGQATNSRAGSEARRVQDEEDHYKERSTSSSQSPPRDLTPGGTVASLDADPVLGPGLSQREKRKLKEVEKMFARAEQDQTGQKKKKRTSGGSNLNTPHAASHQLNQNGNVEPTTPSAWSHTSHHERRPTYSKARSPTLADHQPSSQTLCGHNTSDSPSIRDNVTRPRYTRPVYVDAAVQTDAEEEVAPAPPVTRRKFITPTQRLLKMVLADRMKYEQQKRVDEQPDIAVSTLDSTLKEGKDVAEKTPGEDVEMKDVPLPLVSSPEAAHRSSQSSPSESPWSKSTEAGGWSPTLPFPSSAAHSHRPTNPPTARRLQLTTLPPVPTFSNDSSPVAANVTTPSTTTSAAAQSPISFGAGSVSYPGLSHMTAPSPARKKLSLGDYMSRKGHLSQTPTVEKTQAQAIDAALDASVALNDVKDTSNAVPDPTVMIKPASSIREEAKLMGGAEGSAIDDTPVKQEPPITSPVNLPTSTAALSTNPPANPAAAVPFNLNVLASLQSQPPPSSTQVAPEVMNVLAALKQWQHPRSNSTSSS